MQLTIKLRKRWITSVLKQSETLSHPMPWHRGVRRKPTQIQPASPQSFPRIVQA